MKEVNKKWEIRQKSRARIRFLALLALVALATSVQAQTKEAGVSLTVTVGSFCGNGIVETGEQCDGSQLRGKSCADFGFNGGALSCSSSCRFNMFVCTTNATATTTQNFVCNYANEYTLHDSNNSAKIALPPNFYGQDLDFHAFSYNKSVFQSTKPPPSGKNFVGKVYDFSFVDSEGDLVSTISQAAVLTVAYTNDDVSGITESSLAPYHRGIGDTSWQLVSGATVDTANNTVTFPTANFSSFVLLGSPSPFCGDGSCNGSETCSSCSTDCGACSSSPGGGGGGGGGGIVSAPTPTPNIAFSGRAYPKSSVTILKDAQIAATTVADTLGVFQTSLSGLSAGNFIFSVYSEDKDGVRSSLVTFPVSVTAGAITNITGIFIAPSIAVNKQEVKKGDDIAIFGQSAAESEVTIMINSDEAIFAKTKADKDGIYLHNFDTSDLDYGNHMAKSKASLGGAVSGFSAGTGFKVSDKNVLAVKSVKKILRGDADGNGKVNLVDFSIAAYWYKKSNPPAKIDLNGDGKIDLIDFSILAFNWTG